jgi:hypothetical protein
MVVACFCAAHSAFCQTNQNGLAISAKASLLLGTNESKLFFEVHLVNTTNHEITVLTRKLNCSFNGFALGNEKASWECKLGLSEAVTHDGHRVVPSLYDFSPVTLRPNEKAVITQEVEHFSLSKPLTEDSQIAVRYEISSEWASRFALWNGFVTTKPFNASVKKPR